MSGCIRNGSLFILAFILILVIFGNAFADSTGINADTIVIGQSCALEGPNKALGIGMRNGADAYFAYINANGGIKNKKIKLITYDDGYEPVACKKNTETLIDMDKVFLLFGYVGTPTSKVAAPLAVAKKVPFFAPFTGAEFLRTPVKKEIFNIRASYYQETEMMVERLTQDLGISKISVFYQNDSYGEAGLEGVRRALQKRDLTILSKGHYERNTAEVNDAVTIFNKTTPDAILMIGAYKACAELVREMRGYKSKAVFMNVSFVGGDALGRDLSNTGIGVLVTQVTPFPRYKKIPVVAEYLKLNKEHNNGVKPTYVGMEGFIAAKALCEILKKCPGKITRSKFIATAEEQNSLELGGFEISFSRKDHQGSDMVRLTQICPGGYLERLDNLWQIREY